MKKFLTAFIILASSWVSAQPILSPSPGQLTAWENFKATFGNAWQIEWDITGTPKMIHGPSTSPQIGDPQIIATTFLHQLKDVFGFSSVQQNLLYSGTSPTAVDTFILYHVRFQPHLNGIPILDSRISVHINKKGEIYLVNAAAYRFSAPFDRAETLLTGEAAKAVAMLNIEPPVVLAGEVNAKLGYVYKNDTYVLVWRVIIPTSQPNHDWQIDISQDGMVVNKRDLISHFDGEATVYLHHPLVGDTVRRTLYYLNNDSCAVLGFYADVYNEDTARAISCNYEFIYEPSDPRFDEGNVYFHIQSFVDRLGSLGLSGHKYQMEAQVYEGGADATNASYSPSAKNLHFGRGSAAIDTTKLVRWYRDFAKEEAVIYHEYTHYLEDTLLGPEIGGFDYDYPEAGALSEGLADYFAVSATDDPLVGEWAAPKDIRNADNNLIYPDSMTVSPHHNGQIVSGACWTMRNLMNENLHPDKLTWVALDNSEVNTDFKNFWIILAATDRQIGWSDDLRALHLGFIPRWDTTRPPNTNPVIDSGPYFSPEEPGTVYEGGFYLLCVDAIRNGQPDGTGGNWLLDYYWKSKYVPITMPYSIDQCVDYRPPVINQTRLDSIWCWVYDGLGGVDSALRVVTIYPQPPPPPPAPTCPLLYVWNGSDFIEDNSILSYSGHSVKEQVITDYYHVQKPLVVEDNQYRLQVREVPGEKSFIDQIELLTVDHPLGQKVVTTTDGKILYTAEEFSPISALDDKGEEHAEEVGIKDGILYSSDRPGYLVLTFKLSDKTGEVPLVFGDPARPCRPSGPEGGGRISPNLPLDSSFNAIKTEIQDLEGNWTELAQVPPRDHYTQNFRLIDQNQVRLGEIFKIRTSWISQYSVDEIKFYSVSEEPPQVNTLLPSRVDHSKLGSVSKLVSLEDREFATLVKGEKLDLFFPAENLPLPEGYTREFIVKSSGYYIPYGPEQTASIPDRFELKDNYPNPFNAQTEIQYALPEPSEVNLSVYNIMGQKVKTLVDGTKPAGVHKISWDGRNDSGEIVASGVYFYSLKTGNYTTTKKMTLLK